MTNTEQTLTLIESLNPSVIHTQVIGGYENVEVEISAPALIGSPEEEDLLEWAVLEWAEENLLPWEWFDTDGDRTRWTFVIPFDPENYYAE